MSNDDCNKPQRDPKPDAQEFRLRRLEDPLEQINLALRQKCIVINEAMGWLPAKVRESPQARRLLRRSSRLLQFLETQYLMVDLDDELETFGAIEAAFVRVHGIWPEVLCAMAFRSMRSR